jgi:N utilization substance protein B
VTAPGPADTPAGAPPAGPRPAATPKGGGGAGARPRTAPKSPRRRAREFALQGLYQWLLSAEDAGAIDALMREQDGFDKCDGAHFDALLHGCIAEAAELDAVIARRADRKTTMLSPVEHAALLIGTYELRHCIEVPYRVAINEAVELAKTFGGTDGHKYVNGVLDKAAAELRPIEWQDRQARRAAPRDGA